MSDVEEDDLPYYGGQPDDDLYRDEQQKKVARALGALPERQRTAITLSVYQGLSNRDAAQVMEKMQIRRVVRGYRCQRDICVSHNCL